MNKVDTATTDAYGCPTCGHLWHGGKGCLYSSCWCLSKFDPATMAYTTKMIEGTRP